MGRVSIVPQLETKIGQPLKSWLVSRIHEGKSPDEIAKLLGIGKSKAYDLINEFGLKETLKSVKRLGAGGESELRKHLNDYYAEKRRAGLSPITISRDEEFWRAYLWWLGNTGKPATLGMAINLETIQAWETYLITEKSRFGREFKKPVTHVTLKTYRKRLASFIHWAQKMEIISDEPKANPLRKMMPIRIPKRKPEDMPDELIIKALNSFDDSFEGVRNKTIVEVFLETGMRLGGVTSLKIGDFNWETGIGTVIEKGDKERTVVLSDRLLSQVRKYLELRKPVARSDALWVSKEGEALSDSGIQIFIAKLNETFRDDIKRLAPESHFHAHLFRHIWAKKLVESEVPGFAMMVMGGWENLDLVQHYAAAYSQEKAWSYINKSSPLTSLEKEK